MDIKEEARGSVRVCQTIKKCIVSMPEADALVRARHELIERMMAFDYENQL